MGWKFKSAKRRGFALDVAIEDASDEENVEAKTFTYGYPAYEGQTAAQFKAMVRKGVRAHLDRLNAVVEPVDVSDEYEDV